MGTIQLTENLIVDIRRPTTSPSLVHDHTHAPQRQNGTPSHKDQSVTFVCVEPFQFCKAYDIALSTFRKGKHQKTDVILLTTAK